MLRGTRARWYTFPGAILLLLACAAFAADPRLSGHIVDENEAPVAGARVTVRRANDPSIVSGPVQSDPVGAFSLMLPGAGDYLLHVEREGYYELNRVPVHAEADQEIVLMLNPVHEVFQSINVNEQPSPVDIAQTQNQERLTGTEINDILYPNSHSFRNSLKLMPGVVQDAAGGLHFNGSSENQVQYVLNAFNITDPITAQLRTTVAVEGVRAADYLSGRYSPEFGSGSAGALSISTENGSDAFRYTATNFIPGLSIQQGLRLGNWYPRIGVSGPIVRGRAWFSDTFHSEYNAALITGLPSGQNTRNTWLGSNLLHTQINTTPRNIVFTDFLVNVDNESRVGLSPLDPVSTTRAVHLREYFGSMKDQFYIGARSLVELGYAHNEFSISQTPEGASPYVIAPQGRSGNYFVHSTEGASRDQWLVHEYGPQFHLAGTHQIEGGLDANLLRYQGDFRRTAYELIGLSGQILSQTGFSGPGMFTVHDAAIAPWVLDTWGVAKEFQVSAGLRADWDQLVHRTGWSPRVAFSWAPFGTGHTRVAGGYSVTHDAVPLDPFGRVHDQSAITTEYGGGVPVGPAAITVFALGPGSLRLPRATNWTFGVDQEVSAHLSAGIKYLRRRGTSGFSFVNTLAPDAPASLLPLPNGSFPGIYTLANLRRDHYDSVKVHVHQTLAGQYEWMASYTRSRSQSNAVIDPNALVPLQVLSSLVPMPWDSPNRFLGWAYLPLPWKSWSVAVLADARSGFPFSIQQETGLVSGGVNAYRYPFNFDLNLAVERTLTLRGYRFGLRGGFNNVTNHKNPTAVNNVIGAPQFLQFLADEGRHFVVRIRFVGRAGAK